MPAKFLFISNSANKNIKRLPLKIQHKIDKAFDKIKLNPIAGFKLAGELSKHYKYRIGDYRIVYSFNSKLGRVEIHKVEYRQGVYK